DPVRKIVTDECPNDLIRLGYPSVVVFPGEVVVFNDGSKLVMISLAITSVKPPFGQRVKFDVLPDNDFGSRVTRLRGAMGKTGARDRKRVSLASFCLTGGPDRWRIDGAL
ncbi:hypothetical protein THAOC_12947, partial [Thalassiosira oceanica]